MCIDLDCIHKTIYAGVLWEVFRSDFDTVRPLLYVQSLLTKLSLTFSYPVLYRER